MKYYKLVLDFNDKAAEVAIVNNYVKFKDEYLYEHKDISKKDLDHLKFELNSENEVGLRDVLRNNISYLIFSNRLKAVIEKSKLKGLTFFQLNLSTGNKDYFPYWYTHLAQVTALDIEGSNAKLNEYNGKEIYSFIKPILLEDKIGNLHIFSIYW